MLFSALDNTQRQPLPPDGEALFCAELLGDGFDTGAILTTLYCREGIFRTMGDEKPFTVYRPLTDEPLPPPEYFGFVFD